MKTTIQNKKEAVQFFTLRLEQGDTRTDNYYTTEALKDYLAEAEDNAQANGYEFDLRDEIGAFLEEKEDEGFIFYPFQVEA